MILDPLLRVRGDLELLSLLIEFWLLSVISCRMGGSEGRYKIDDVFQIHMVLVSQGMACRVGKTVVGDCRMSRMIVVGNYQSALQHHSHKSYLIKVRARGPKLFRMPVLYTAERMINVQKSRSITYA
jgi:hypothetical protein